jgi:hypothetical protein
MASPVVMAHSVALTRNRAGQKLREQRAKIWRGGRDGIAAATSAFPSD